MSSIKDIFVKVVTPTTLTDTPPMCSATPVVGAPAVNGQGVTPTSVTVSPASIAANTLMYGIMITAYYLDASGVEHAAYYMGSDTVTVTSICCNNISYVTLNATVTSSVANPITNTVDVTISVTGLYDACAEQFIKVEDLNP